MNLYSSFSNLLETWVTEGFPQQQDEFLGSDCRNSITASPDMGIKLRSESEDSGVEMVSSDMFLTSLCSPVSVGNTEIDPVTTEREEDSLTLASTSQSSVISVPSSASSSSQSLCPTKDETPRCLKVEQALQRSDHRRLRNIPESDADDVVLRRRTHTPSLPRQHTSTLVTGQRSESFGLRKTVGPLVPSRQMSEPCRRALPPYLYTLPAQTKIEDNGEEETGLSPGLNYLERVCQMLEEIARLQMHNNVLQMEMDALQEHQAKQVSQAPETHQCDDKVAAEDFSSCQTVEVAGVEQVPSDPEWQNYYARHFRKRSASDTRILIGHSRQLKADSRGQHASTNDLLGKAEYHKKQELKKEKNKIKTWKMRIGSLGRHDLPLKSDSELNGQQMHSSEGKKRGRRLSQLFRRQRETLPA